MLLRHGRAHGGGDVPKCQGSGRATCAECTRQRTQSVRGQLPLTTPLATSLASCEHMEGVWHK